jgi:primosomal protein N'
MRGWLISTVAVTGLLAGVPQQSRAQGIPTIDAAEIAQTINTLHQLQQQYQAVMGIFGTLLRVVDPNSIATNIIGTQPLPGAPQISQMITGSGNFGSLGSLASQFLSANTVYTPQSTGSDDFNAAFMQRSSNTLAGVQAMAQQSMASLQQHIIGLSTVQQQLSDVQTQADVSAIQGRLQAEQANLAAQGAQAQYLGTLLAAQQQQYQLQELQSRRQSADALLASVTGSGAASGNSAAPQLSAMNLPTFSSTGP